MYKVICIIFNYVIFVLKEYYIIKFDECYWVVFFIEEGGVVN